MTNGFAGADTAGMTASISFSHKPVLTGQLVQLRPLGPQDVDDLMDALNDTEMLRLTGTHSTFTRAQIEQHCATRADHDDRLDYAIVDRGSGRFLGDLAIMDLNPINLSCGFRIALRTAMTGRGYGSDAARVIVDYLFDLGIHRIELEVYAFNPRARHVYEKVGFVHEGTLREALTWDGQWVDSELMAILDTDPRPARTFIG